MKNSNLSRCKLWIAAVICIAAILYCACAGAETAQDISSKCEFFAGSGRTGEHAFTFTLSKQYKKWNKNRLYSVVTEWIRRFQPDVLLTHDLQGEYGHGAHRACSDAVMHCVEYASDAKKYPGSARKYGTWDTPKCYIHLWKENVIDMDWRQPLEAFGGKTGFDVAVEGFRCHRSQQKTDYHVEDWGPWDNSLFGLYRTTVGPDEEKDDFFENLNY